MYDWGRLIVVRAGSVRVSSAFGTRHVEVGDVVILGPNTSCGAVPEEPVVTTAICLQRDYVADQLFWLHAGQFADHLDARWALASCCTETAQIARIGEESLGQVAPFLDELVALSGIEPDHSRFYRLQSLLFAVLDLVMPHMGTVGQYSAPKRRCAPKDPGPLDQGVTAVREDVRRAAQLINDDLAHRWTLNQLASAVHLSPSQLGRVFVAAFGEPPIAYLTTLRVQKLAHLLRTTDRTISALAREVGWNDPDFASKQFRCCVGVPPGRYRTMHRANQLRRSAHQPG